MPDDRIDVALYEQDLAAWAMNQAAALRAAGKAIAAGGNQVVIPPESLDWENLAEEIEDLARRDRRELGSRLSSIVEHLAKLEFSPADSPRAGWAETVLRDREEIDAILRDSPSLRPILPTLLTERSDSAIRRAARSLALHGETAAAGAASARLGSGYQLDDVIGSWLPGDPQP